MVLSARLTFDLRFFPGGVSYSARCREAGWTSGRRVVLGGRRLAWFSGVVSGSRSYSEGHRKKATVVNIKKNPTQLCLQPCASIEKIFLLVIWNSVCDIYQEISKHPLSFSLILFCTHLIGAAAAVELAVEPLVVPNFSCRRRTSRGGLAAEFTYAILTWRPVRGNNTLGQTLNSLKNIKKTIMNHNYRNKQKIPKSFFFVLYVSIYTKLQKLVPPLGLLACADVIFCVSILSRSSRSSCSLRYNSLHDSYSCGDSRLKSRRQWRIHSSSDSSVNH